MPRKKRQAGRLRPDPHPIEPSGMAPYLARFLEVSSCKGLSARTVEIRDRMLRLFIRWCSERDLDRPQDVTRPILESYQRHVFHTRKSNGEPLSFATQQQRLGPVKAFFRWLARENLILADPASDLELPRARHRLPRHVLTPEEVERILAQTALHGDLGIRDRAILETLYSTGIRRAELVNLTVRDVDPQSETLLVRQGKGGKDRFVPLGQRAATWIERYQAEVGPRLVFDPDPGVLFLHEYGEPFRKNRLGDLVRKYIEQAGIDKPGACHLFRHTMATLMLDNGADIRHIQAILGHSQLSTTEIYTHVAIRKLRSVHALTHPAECGGSGPTPSSPSDWSQPPVRAIQSEGESSDRETGRE